MSPLVCMCYCHRGNVSSLDGCASCSFDKFINPEHYDCASYGCSVDGCPGNYNEFHRIALDAAYKAIATEPEEWDTCTMRQDRDRLYYEDGSPIPDHLGGRDDWPNDRIQAAQDLCEAADKDYERWASDRKPLPSDGPDYHAEYAAWRERNWDRVSGVGIGVDEENDLLDVCSKISSPDDYATHSEFARRQHDTGKQFGKEEFLANMTIDSGNGFKERTWYEDGPYPPPKFQTTTAETYPVKPPDSEFERTLRSKFREAKALLLRKHADYGAKNIAHSPGGALNGLRVRIYDKVARLNNLAENGVAPENESVRDTYLDLANYAIIALMVIDGDWPDE